MRTDILRPAQLVIDHQDCRCRVCCMFDPNELTPRRIDVERNRAIGHGVARTNLADLWRSRRDFLKVGLRFQPGEMWRQPLPDLFDR